MPSYVEIGEVLDDESRSVTNCVEQWWLKEVEELQNNKSIDVTQILKGIRNLKLGDYYGMEYIFNSSQTLFDHQLQPVDNYKSLMNVIEMVATISFNYNSSDCL